MSGYGLGRGRVTWDANAAAAGAGKDGEGDGAIGCAERVAQWPWSERGSRRGEAGATKTRLQLCVLLRYGDD